MTKKIAYRLVFLSFLAVLLVISLSVAPKQMLHSSPMTKLLNFTLWDQIGAIDSYYECLQKEAIVFADHNPTHTAELFSSLYAYLEMPTVKSRHKIDLSYIHEYINHDIGMLLFAKTRGLRESFLLCDNFYDGGCYHSVIMTYTDESTKDSPFNFDTVLQFCKQIAQEDQGHRYFHPYLHGLGHTTVVKYQGDIEKTLHTCDKVKSPYSQTKCYDGAFVEYSKGESHFGVHSHKLPGRIPLPCNSLEEKYKPTCNLVMGRNSYIPEKGTYSFTIGASVCNKEASYPFHCFLGLSHRILDYTQNDLVAAKKICDAMSPTSITGWRKAIVMAHTFELPRPTDEIRICHLLPDVLTDNCYPLYMEYVRFAHELY